VRRRGYGAQLLIGDLEAGIHVQIMKFVT
jgi:hypothetical protein